MQCLRLIYLMVFNVAVVIALRFLILSTSIPKLLYGSHVFPAMVTTKNLLVINLSVVACGDRVNEALVMLKSACLWNRAPIHAHIFTEDQLQPKFKEHMDAWPLDVKKRFKYTLHPIQYPPHLEFEWKKLFKKCASQRLFIPDILKNLESILYVDTDVLFLRPIDDIWKILEKFNSTQIAAVSPEGENGSVSWYNKIAHHPYVPPHGINSGVLLMNMTRMIHVGFLSQIISFYKRHRSAIQLADQDLINIYFHHFPEQLYLFPCNWNYRTDHCPNLSRCEVAEENGIFALHGSRSTFQNGRQPTFRAMYQVIRDHSLGDLISTLQEKIVVSINKSSVTSCDRISAILTEQFLHQGNIYNDNKRNLL